MHILLSMQIIFKMATFCMSKTIRNKFNGMVSDCLSYIVMNILMQYYCTIIRKTQIYHNPSTTYLYLLVNTLSPGTD